MVRYRTFQLRKEPAGQANLRLRRAEAQLPLLQLRRERFVVEVPAVGARCRVPDGTLGELRPGALLAGAELTPRRSFHPFTCLQSSYGRLREELILCQPLCWHPY